MHNRSKSFAVLMLLLLCAFWGMTFPATKIALDTTDPLHFLALRFILASIGFYIVRLLLSMRSNSRKISSERSRIWKAGIIIGFLLFCGFSLQVFGLKYTTASRSGFFTGLLVILVTPLALIFRSSKMPALASFGLIPAAIGIYLISDPQIGGLNKGDLLTIACAFVFALQMVVLEIMVKHDEIVFDVTLIQIATVAALSLTLSFILGATIEISTEGWLAAIYTALFGTIGAVWLQTKYQPKVPAGYAGLIFATEPIFAAFFAWLIIGDQWTSRSLIGAAFIIGGMILSSVFVLNTKK